MSGQLSWVRARRWLWNVSPQWKHVHPSGGRVYLPLVAMVGNSLMVVSSSGPPTNSGTRTAAVLPAARARLKVVGRVATQTQPAGVFTSIGGTDGCLEPTNGLSLSAR